MTGHDRMDLEMQLLADDNGGGSSREKLYRIILVIKSSIIFTSGAATDPHGGSLPVSRVSSSENIVNNPWFNMLLEHTDNLRLFFFYIYQEPEVAEAGDSLAASPEHSITIDEPITNETTVNQLQHSQSKQTILTFEPEVAEADDSLAASPEHSITIDEPITNEKHSQSQHIISDVEANSRRELKPFSPSPTSARRFSHMVLDAFNSKTIILLSLAAVLSLGFGMAEEGLENGWYDGVIVLTTVIVLVLFTSIREYWQVRRARKKLERQHIMKEGAEEVHVIRGGVPKWKRESELVCGDDVLLKKDYQVPANGLFVADQAMELDNESESDKVDERHPFSSYGERVIDGDAQMAVTSTDMNTGLDEMKRKAVSDLDTSFKLEAHLDKLNTCIHHTGLIISILILIVLFSRYIAGKLDEENGYRIESKPEPTAMRNFANFFKKSIQESKYTAGAWTKLLCVSLIGITEGVPFVVSVAILYWNHETLSGKATEQDAHAVVNMASVTRICTDKFGNFTEDEMEVDKLFIGREVISGCTMISPDVIETLCDLISTSTEMPFRHWARDKLGFKKDRISQRWRIFDKRGTNPFEETCGVLMGGTGDSEMMCHWNGPANEILKMCTQYYDNKGRKAAMDDVAWFFDQANDMTHKQLTIAFACKRTNNETLDEEGFTLVALLGLKKSSRGATREAVEACRKCGVETLIVSRKKVPVNIALECGLITNDDSEALVITGEDFRKLTDTERAEIVDKIRVMSEALPFDILLLVDSLRQKGQVVAYLGERTDEAPALKAADIGIATGTWSSKTARESSNIIIWEGSFVDVISMVNSGKCIFGNVQKFLQLVLIMTIASALINFFGTVVLGDAPLTAVQLVWVNLAVTFLGGLALLAKPLTDKPMGLVPVTCRKSLITADMTRNIAAQVLYQATCLVLLQAKGSRFIGTSQNGIKFLVFNSFILCQFFNQFNARELQEKNFFKGIHRHKGFWIAVVIFVVLQTAFVMVQDILGYGTRLNWKLWAGCVLFGAGSWPVDWLGKCTSQLPYFS